MQCWAGVVRGYGCGLPDCQRAAHRKALSAGLAGLFGLSLVLQRYRLAAATATAGALGFAQHARYIVLEADTLYFERVQAVLVKHVNAVFDSADTLVQLLVLAGNTCEVIIALAQLVQGFAQFREVIHQWVVFNMHGFELLGSDVPTLASAENGYIDPGQADAWLLAHGSHPNGWLHCRVAAEVTRTLASVRHQSL
jgi:uncharacterized membrane protein